VSGQELKWRDAMFLGSELTQEEVRGIREMVVREVVKNMSAAYGALRSSRAAQLEELPGPSPALIVAAVAIGDDSGVVRVNFMTERGVSGLTLHYELIEGARTAEGLRVRVGVGHGKRTYFIVEGVVPSAKGER
jgi:hypothetical protein